MSFAEKPVTNSTAGTEKTHAVGYNVTPFRRLQNTVDARLALTSLKPLGIVPPTHSKLAVRQILRPIETTRRTGSKVYL